MAGEKWRDRREWQKVKGRHLCADGELFAGVVKGVRSKKIRSTRCLRMMTLSLPLILAVRCLHAYYDVHIAGHGVAAKRLLRRFFQ